MAAKTLKIKGLRFDTKPDSAFTESDLEQVEGEGDKSEKRQRKKRPGAKGGALSPRTGMVSQGDGGNGDGGE